MSSLKRILTRRDFIKQAVAATGSAFVLAACQPKEVTTVVEKEVTKIVEKEVTKEVTTVVTEEVTKVVEKVVTATPVPTPEPVTFSYLRPVWGPATHAAGSAYEQELFTRANVVIESQIVPVIEYETKLPVMVAGGTYADLMWHAGPDWGTAHDLIEQGAFLAINEYLDKYPAVKDAIGEALWALTRSPDGNNYFFPAPLACYVPFPISYRVDIYDQLGLGMPTTLDEFVEQLKEIRDKVPDMVPLTAHQYTLWYFQNVAVSHGYAWGNWVPDDGEPDDNPAKIVPGMLKEGCRNFLAFVQSLRKENLIDPDYMITTGLEGITKFRAGTAVTMVGHWGAMMQDNVELKKTVPEGNISYMPQLTGPDRSMGALTLSGFDRGFSISVEAKDKADKIFQFLNWVYTDGYEFMRYGIEGKTYTVAEDGTKLGIPDTERETGWTSDNVEPFGFPIKAADTYPDWGAQLASFKQNNLEDKFGDTIKMYVTSAENAMPNWNHLTFSKTSAEKGSMLSEQYTTPAQETIAIDPEASLSVWDNALDEWLANGGEQIISEVNETQKDKSPVKPVYELPEKWKSYLS